MQVGGITLSLQLEATLVSPEAQTVTVSMITSVIRVGMGSITIRWAKLGKIFVQ